jgi:hypothetical protein
VRLLDPCVDYNRVGGKRKGAAHPGSTHCHKYSKSKKFIMSGPRRGQLGKPMLFPESWLL